MTKMISVSLLFTPDLGQTLLWCKQLQSFDSG